MNFAWAIEQLNKGNKVRRSSWENQAFFLYKNTVNNIIYQHGSDGDPEDVRCSTSSAEIFADDWENHACPTVEVRQAEEPDCRPGDVLFVKDHHARTHDLIENDLNDLKANMASGLKELNKIIYNLSKDFYNHRHNTSIQKQEA
jgi:hypothetical protein